MNAPSLVVTVGASFMNNWPMTILGFMSIQNIASTVALSGQAFTTLVFSNIIGNNLGPHFFPLGSLAILMWLETMKRKGVNIRLWSLPQSRRRTFHRRSGCGIGGSMG